jgi:hypothetical protein
MEDTLFLLSGLRSRREELKLEYTKAEVLISVLEKG